MKYVPMNYSGCLDKKKSESHKEIEPYLSNHSTSLKYKKGLYQHLSLVSSTEMNFER